MDREKKSFEHINELDNFGLTIIKSVLSKEESSKIYNRLNEIEVTRNGYDVFEDSTRYILWNPYRDDPELFLNKTNNPQIMDIVTKTLKEQVNLGSFGAIRSKKGEYKPNTHIDSRIPIR